VKTPDLDWRKSSRSNTQGACVEVAWRKSSRSNAEVDCVEVAHVAEAVAVRDSKNTAGPTLAFPTASWHAFVVRD